MLNILAVRRNCEVSLPQLICLAIWLNSGYGAVIHCQK